MDGYKITQVPEINYYNIHMDESGYYFLIEPDFTIGKISVTLKEDKIFIETVHGNRCQDIYTYLINKYGEFFSKLHCAYLGKELKKAEIAMVTGGEYYQE